MSILLDERNRVVIQGITGKMGRFSANDLKAYGTCLLGGVTPGRSDFEVEGLPVFPDMATACREVGADTSLVYVPPHSALDAIVEAIEAGCRLVVYPGDGFPVLDAMEMRAAAKANGAVVVAPNTPGLISPGKAKVGFIPSFCCVPGPLGVISQSGSLSYESCNRLTLAGFGQSTIVGIGGDPIKGLSALEALELFHRDPETEAIVFLGEIGGQDEAQAAEYARRPDAKPMAALVVGKCAPRGKKMGHASALIGSHAETHEAKVAALRDAGAEVAESVDRLAEVVGAALMRALPGKDSGFSRSSGLPSS